MLLGAGWGALGRHPVTCPSSRDANDQLKIASWNLCNFPGDHDIAWMQRTVAEIGADVFAFQEVRKPDAVANLVPGFTVATSTSGGRRNQYLSVAFDPTRFELRDPAWQDERLTMDGLVRPAWIVPLRSSSGQAIDVVVVHLKATRSGHALRLQQWDALVDLLRHRGSHRIVLGDFNVAGGPDMTAADELARLEMYLDRARMTRLPTVGGCTAYWQGVRHDAWLEASTLDFIFVGPGWPKDADPSQVSHAGTHCQTHRCDPFRSTQAYPDEAFARGSDHCPIFATLQILDSLHDPSLRSRD